MMSRRLLAVLLLLAGATLVALTALSGRSWAEGVSDHRAAAQTPGARVYLPLFWRVPGAGQADLVIGRVYINIRGYTGGCASSYGPIVVTACVVNQGDRDAGAFDLSVNGVANWGADGVAAGDTLCIETKETPFLFIPFEIVADSGQEVAESDETNNTWEGILPLPTAPVLCTATPTPAPNG